MNDTTRAVALSIVLVVAVVATSTALVGVASATESATIVAEPSASGATSTHTVSAKVESEDDGANLTSINIDYNSATRPASIENVSASDVQTVGIDQDGDGTIDTDLSGTITGTEHANKHHTITFQFDESYVLNANDTLIIAYQGVENPNEPGDYQTQIAINYGSTDHPSKATLTITDDTTSSSSTTITSGSADPSSVAPGESVSNQIVRFSVSGVSGDGNTDTHYVTFPDALAGQLSPNSASVVSGPASISSSIQLVDGPDGDGRDDTLTFQTDNNSGSPSDLVLEVDTGVQYPDASSGTQYPIDVRVDDSDGSSAAKDGVATVTVEDTSTSTDTTQPTISSYQVTNPSGTELRVSFESSELLTDIEVVISGDASHTLTEGDFSVSSASGTYTYTGTYDPGASGSYTATLETAADDAGNDGGDGQSASQTISSGSGGSGGGGGGGSDGGSGGATIDDDSDSSSGSSGSGGSGWTTTTAGSSATTTDGSSTTTTDGDANQNAITPFAPTTTTAGGDSGGGFPALPLGLLGVLMLLAGIVARRRLTG